jgi:hypothetical protein
MLLPGFLSDLLQDVVLPRAKRDTSHLFRERFERDDELQTTLRKCEPRMSVWFDHHTQARSLPSTPQSHDSHMHDAM